MIPDHPPPTERLRFRLWREDDRAHAIDLWGDHEVTRLIDARSPLSPEQIEARLQAQLEMQRVHGVAYWPMFLANGGDFVGCCGLRPYPPEPEIFETGFQIVRRHWREGLATEAARAVIRHAFEDRGVPALFAGHNPNNEASRALLLKLGFRFTHEALYPPTGLMHPSYRLDR